MRDSSLVQINGNVLGNGMECVMPNKQFWGETGGSLVKNISLTDCKEKCKTTPGCNWFNWNHSECEDCKHKNSCFLLSSQGTQSKEGKGRFSGGVSSAICFFEGKIFSQYV